MFVCCLLVWLARAGWRCFGCCQSGKSQTKLSSSLPTVARVIEDWETDQTHTKKEEEEEQSNRFCLSEIKLSSHQPAGSAFHDGYDDVSRWRGTIVQPTTTRQFCSLFCSSFLFLIKLIDFCLLCLSLCSFSFLVAISTNYLMPKLLSFSSHLSLSLTHKKRPFPMRQTCDRSKRWLICLRVRSCCRTTVAGISSASVGHGARFRLVIFSVSPALLISHPQANQHESYTTTIDGE